MSCNATLLHRRDRTKLNSTSLNIFCHSVYSLVHFVSVVGDVNGPLYFTIAVVVQILQVNLQFAHCSQILVDVNAVIAILAAISPGYHNITMPRLHCSIEVHDRS